MKNRKIKTLSLTQPAKQLASTIVTRAFTFAPPSPKPKPSRRGRRIPPEMLAFFESKPEFRHLPEPERRLQATEACWQLYERISPNNPLDTITVEVEDLFARNEQTLQALPVEERRLLLDIKIAAVGEILRSLGIDRISTMLMKPVNKAAELTAHLPGGDLEHEMYIRTCTIPSAYFVPYTDVYMKRVTYFLTCELLAQLEDEKRRRGIQKRERDWREYQAQWGKLEQEAHTSPARKAELFREGLKLRERVGHLGFFHNTARRYGFEWVERDIQAAKVLFEANPHLSAADLLELITACAELDREPDETGHDPMFHARKGRKVRFFLSWLEAIAMELGRAYEPAIVPVPSEILYPVKERG